MVKLTTLDNGLRVVTEAMPARCIASVGFWTPAGSARESRSVAGISHLLEHMLFKSTGRRSAFRIAAALDRVGGDLNAYTEREYSCLHCTLLGDHVALALDIMSDMIFNSAISEPELRTERAVVLEEIADYEDSPEEVVHDQAMRLLWPTHPLGTPVHGSEKAVLRITRRDLVSFRDQWYSPHALVLAAAGHVDHDHLVKLLERNGLPDGRPAPRLSHRSPKLARGCRILERDTEQAHLCLAVPAASRRDEPRYVDSILASALGAAPSSRLFQEVRERRGLAYNVGAFHIPCANAGILGVYAGTLPSKLGRVARLLSREVKRICRGGVTGREVERAKGFMIASIRMGQDSPGSEAQRIGHSVLHHGRVVEPEETIAKLNAVTAERVTERAAELFADGIWVKAFAGRVDGQIASGLE
jgi:predicted Zn-dependent peptidase